MNLNPWLIAYVSSVIGSFITIIAMTVMRNEYRHSVGRIGWLALVLLSPPVGLVLFLWLGGAKISKEHERRPSIRYRCPPKRFDSRDVKFAAVDEMLRRRGLSYASQDNDVVFLSDPRSLRSAYLDMIEGAKQAIYLMTFIIDHEDSATDVIDRLCEKARAGVQVRFLCDGFGSFFAPEEELQRLRDAGGQACRFKPFSRLSRLAYFNFRNHRKLMVVDGRRAILGGANLVEKEITDSPTSKTWIDLSLKITGPVVSQLEDVFCSDWNFVTDENLPPAEVVHCDQGTDGQSLSTLTVVPVGPDSPNEILDDFWHMAIHRADHRIWICTPYFVPPDGAVRALEAAGRRGVDLRIMVPDRSDLWPVDYVRYDYFTDLIKVGAKIYRYPNRVVHTKLGIIDDSMALTGSANFDVRSFFLNYELSVLFRDRPSVERLSGWYEQMVERCETGIEDHSLSRKAIATVVRVFASEL